MRHIKHSSMWAGLMIILPLFWKGITCQVLPGYSIDVPPRVRVQEGHCVTIPCKFTANYSNTFKNSSGFWKLDGATIVASNDKSRPGKKPNFILTGNPDSGDCSLTITDARKEDAGTYFFRFEESKTSNVKIDYKVDYVTPTITVTGRSTNPGMTNNSSIDLISFRNIAIAFICGMSTTILILLLYILITRKKNTKKAANVAAEEPPPEDIYMNINKPKENAEEATNNIQLDSHGATMAGDNLHYFPVAFTAKSSKVPSSYPEPEYAEVNVK